MPLSQKQQLELQRERVRCYMAVMATYEGRRVMHDLITYSGVGESIWEVSAKIHYRAGRQDLGLELQRQLRDMDFVKYKLMQQEALDREQLQAQLAGSVTAPADEE